MILSYAECSLQSIASWAYTGIYHLVCTVSLQLHVIVDICYFPVSTAKICCTKYRVSMCWLFCRCLCWSLCWSLCRCFCWSLCRSLCWLCCLFDFLVVNGYSFSLCPIYKFTVLIQCSVESIKCRGKDLTFARSSYLEFDCIKLTTARLIKRTIMCVIIILYVVTVIILGEISTCYNYCRSPCGIKHETQTTRLNRVKIRCVAFLSSSRKL